MRLNVAVQVAIHLKYCFASLDKDRIEPREIKDPDSTVEPSSSTQLPKRAEYLGVLKANKKSRKLDDDEPHDWSCPTEAIVSCHGGNATSVGGMDVTDQDMTCAEACGTLCCNGDGACDDFYGNVCKDGMSCNGVGACLTAHVDYVYNGCYGDYSCELANIREVDGGCFHKDSCFKAGFRGDGYVELIKDSCIGVESCKRMGRRTNHSIVDGCRGKRSCYQLAEDGSIGSDGSDGFIENGCWGRDACQKLAEDEPGSIGFIKNACKGEVSCERAADRGYIGYILDSCLEKEACRNAAYSGGNITFIKSSCNGTNSCYSAARGGNIPTFISGFNNSCNNEYACYYIAYYGGVIQEGLNNCCNGARDCENVENQNYNVSVPAECAA